MYFLKRHSILEGGKIMNGGIYVSNVAHCCVIWDLLKYQSKCFPLPYRNSF